MSIPPPDTSSDDYSDYYASEDNELLNGTPVLSASVRKTTKRRTRLDEFGLHYLGKMDIQCKCCGAFHWIDERKSDSSLINPVFMRCCRNGQVRLPDLREPHEPLRKLFEGDDSSSKLFRKNIRKYNSANAFTSLVCQYDNRAKKGGGPEIFSIHGELRRGVNITRKNSACPYPSKPACT